ncbi:MAG TPA: FAD-dependent oxidoreductase, partial [Gemmatimonadales bacterium]|nr:FAD-dependent oxidoreductase [Gemmatimonadales bacterium]
TAESRSTLKTGAWRNMRPIKVESRSPCTEACPAAVPIPRYLHEMAAGDPAAAYATFTLRNPFPRITGRVCPHPCEDACNRGDAPLAIRALERYLGDEARTLADPVAERETGRRVAVIGSGPAGLAAAYYLRRSGHAVTVFERRAKAGGMLRYGIPEYRLPSAVVDDEVERLAGMGVEFRTGTTLGRDLELEDLEGSFDAVFAAIGAGVGGTMGIEGESLLEPGLAFLEQLAEGFADLPGERCAVIGGGNTAMDVARALRRLGARVTVLYRRTEMEMPAIAEEFAAALADGVGFRFLTQPRSVAKVPGGLSVSVETMRPGEPDPSGRRRPEPTGEMASLVFDAVFTAVGERAEVEALPPQLRGDDGWLEVGPHGETPNERIFVGGDLATGPATVVDAIAWGRRATDAINARIGGGYALPLWMLEERVEVIGPDAVNRATFAPLPRLEAPELSPAERLAAGFTEETATIVAAQVLAEIERCFSCGYCNSCGTCFVFCPDAAIGWDDGPVFDFDYCKGCGVCTSECPGHVLLFVKEAVHG